MPVIPALAPGASGPAGSHRWSSSRRRWRGRRRASAEPPLSLAEALKIAVARSPQIVSQRAMVDAAREMAVAGGELPDPKLKLGVENVPTDGADAGRSRATS